MYSFGVTWGKVDPDLWLHVDLVLSEGGIQIFIDLALPEAMLIQIYGYAPVIRLKMAISGRHAHIHTGKTDISI